MEFCPILSTALKTSEASPWRNAPTPRTAIFYSFARGKVGRITVFGRNGSAVDCRGARDPAHRSVNRHQREPAPRREPLVLGPPSPAGQPGGSAKYAAAAIASARKARGKAMLW